MRTILAVLLLVVALPAWAVCPIHQPTIKASVDGKLKLCPSEVDFDGDPVGTGFYQSCEARATWAGGGTATFAITAPVAGTAMVISFPAAKGAGSVSGDCTNADGIRGPAVTSTVTFRRGITAGVTLSQ